jgi:hypothetical protein
MRTNQPLLVILASLAFLANARSTSAGAIGLARGSNFCLGFAAGECLFRDQDIILDEVSPYSLAPFHKSDEYDTALLDVIFSGAASSSFGSYGASLTANFVGEDAPFSFLQFGGSSLDRLIVGHPLFTGQSGQLEIDWHVAGTMSSSGRSRAQANLRSCVGLPGSIPMVGEAETVSGVTCDRAMFTTSGVDVVTFSLPIFYGSPFDLRNDFLTTAQFLAGTGVGDAAIDYFHTAGLVGLRAFAADGTPIPDAVFTAESGVTYTSHGVVPVPEPTSLLLVGSGIAGVIARVRQSRRSQQVHFARPR